MACKHKTLRNREKVKIIDDSHVYENKRYI